MYGWTVAYGYGLLFIGAGGGGESLPLPVVASNYLCLEFGSDAVLVRKVNLHGCVHERHVRAILPDSAIPRCKGGIFEHVADDLNLVWLERIDHLRHPSYPSGIDKIVDALRKSSLK